MRVLLLCAKKYQSIQKRHVKSGLFCRKSGLGLDLVWTSWRRLRVKCEGPAVGRVCVDLLTALIIRVGGKLLCQVFFGGKWLMRCWLVDFLGAQGLDTRFCWEFWCAKERGHRLLKSFQCFWAFVVFRFHPSKLTSFRCLRFIQIATISICWANLRTSSSLIGGFSAKVGT